MIRVWNGFKIYRLEEVSVMINADTAGTTSMPSMSITMQRKTKKETKEKSQVMV